MPSEARCLDAGGRSVIDRRVTLSQLASLLGQGAARARSTRARLVALSGIDGSGKSHLAAELGTRLERCGIRTAVIGVDPWQSAKSHRIQPRDPGRAFYERAIRFEALFETLVDPLVRTRGIDRVFEARRNDNDLVYPKHYRFEDIELVILEGIFLLRADLVPRYDLSVWVDCSFETALARAHARNQEGLSAGDIEREYGEIYFPAQRLHFALDSPRDTADLVLPNDPGAP